MFVASCDDFKFFKRKNILRMSVGNDDEHEDVQWQNYNEIFISRNWMSEQVSLWISTECQTVYIDVHKQF